MGAITLISDVMPTLLPMRDRSPGVHISEIIHDLAVRLQHYTPRPADEGFNMAQLELGNCFEWAHIERLMADSPGRFVRIGELEKDGLYGTPDLIDVDEETVDEFKCTWTSSRHGDNHDGPKMAKYWWQIKAYCHMLGWRRGRLRVCYVNGAYDYVVGGQPQYRCWEQVFTKKELVDHWGMLVSRGRQLARR